MILMATMFDFSLEEQRGLIGFLNSWNYGVSLYLIITIIISFFLKLWGKLYLIISFFTVIMCREVQFCLVCSSGSLLAGRTKELQGKVDIFLILGLTGLLSKSSHTL